MLPGESPPSIMWQARQFPFMRSKAIALPSAMLLLSAASDPDEIRSSPANTVAVPDILIHLLDLSNIITSIGVVRDMADGSRQADDKSA